MLMRKGGLYHTYAQQMGCELMFRASVLYVLLYV